MTGRGGQTGSPQRTCIGCRRVRPAGELVRVVRAPDGTLVVGRTRPGRGAWLCAGSDECMARAARRQSFGRALRAPVADEAVHALRNGLSEHARMELRRNTQVGED